MKYFLFLITLISSTSFAFTQAEIASCKASVQQAYNTQCKGSVWNTDHYVTSYDQDCQPGYDEALARCDLGKVWLYQALWHQGTKYEVYRMSMIKLAPLYTVSQYTDKIELSIHQTTGLPLIKHCYFNNQNLSWFGFFDNDSACNGYPTTGFVFDYTTTASYRDYFYPHLIGYSYPDTAATYPIYSCKGTFTDTRYALDPGIIKTYYFLSLQSNCNGKTKINATVGFGKNLTP